MPEWRAERYLRRSFSRSIVQSRTLAALLKWRRFPKATQETRKRVLSKFDVSSYVVTALSMAHRFRQTEKFASGAQLDQRSGQPSSFDYEHLQNFLLDQQSRLLGLKRQAQDPSGLLRQQYLVIISMSLECGSKDGQRALCKRWRSNPVNLCIDGQFALRFLKVSDDHFSKQEEAIAMRKMPGLLPIYLQSSGSASLVWVKNRGTGQLWRAQRAFRCRNTAKSARHF